MRLVEKIKQFINRPSRRQLEERISNLEGELHFYNHLTIPVIREDVNFKTICCETKIPICEAKPYIVEYMMKKMNEELWEEVKCYVQMESFIDDEFGCHRLRLKLRVGVEGNEIETQ